MIKFPNAKINLGLNIVARRADGYHNIETVFYPIALKDVLEIVPSKGNDSSLTTYGRAIDCPTEKNLVMKAYRLLEKEFNLPAVDIFLHKNIPDGAGLGGGSADASFTLLILNELFSLNLSQDEMAQRAAALGADCAFFIYNTPMSASGIGNEFSSAQVDLSGKTLLLVKPDIYVSTAEAYSNVTPRVAEKNPKEIVSTPIKKWKSCLTNDFEQSVFSIHPRLAEIKNTIYDFGAVYASMSGSGSSMFGIYENAIMAEKAKEALKIKDSFVINL